MSWFSIFKIYNLKLIKKDKVLLLLTTLSILFTISIALIIPQVQFWNEKYLNDNIYAINGGDLSIVIGGKKKEEFKNKIDELKASGLEVNTSYYNNAAYINNSNNNMGSIIYGNYDLKEDEIIISSVIAKNMNLNIGDKIDVNTKESGTITYTIKEIEYIAKGVNRDSELLGYGKVQALDNIDTENKGEIIFITGRDGKELKQELVAIEEGNMYFTVDDKKQELEDQALIESAVLGTLSSVSYIVSSLCIITTTIVLILKRKKDIAILRILSINIKSIKKAIGLELLLVITVPLIVGTVISYPISKLLLEYKGVLDSYFTIDNLSIIFKGIILNILILLSLIYMSLKLIEKIKPIYLIKDDEMAIKASIKGIIKKIILVIPIILLAYAMYTKEIGNILSGIVVIIFILVFLLLVSLMVKIVYKTGIKNSITLYVFRNIKENFFTFVLTLLSITATLWFILIGFHLEGTIKDNLNKSIKEALPYNYKIDTDDDYYTDKVLKNNKSINSYNKMYAIVGELLNDVRNPMYKNISVNEINKEDYNAKFNIVEGEDLFQGEDGILISDYMAKRTDLKINDILNIKTDSGNINLKIKGFYKSAGLNTLTIYKEKQEIAKDVLYDINAKSPDFIKELKSCDIYNIGSMGDRLVKSITKFLDIFKVLSLVSIISVLIFNINIVNISHSIEIKDEEILKALGLGRKFIFKSTLIKIILIIILSSLLSVGLYSLIIKLFFSLMFNLSISLNINTIIILILSSIVVALISFNYIFRKTDKSLNLLREY